VVPPLTWHHDCWTPDAVGIRPGILPGNDRLPPEPSLMIRSLTRSRSADFHRATMLRLTVGALLLWLLWEPIRPVRVVTADALSTAADLIAR
jgi:hypothetical protein